MTREETATLVARSAQGDTRAFDQLVTAHRQPLVRFLCRHTGDLEEAMEVAQESFLKAWQALGRFRGEAGFKTWLYQIALNLLRDHHRKNSRGQVVAAPEDLSLAAPQKDPAAESSLLVLHQRVMAHMGHLTDRQRAVINLRLVAGHSFEDTARILESPVGTIKATYFQAIQKLRASLAEGGVPNVTA